MSADEFPRSFDRQIDDIAARMASIDATFADATGWGSWMVELANERESLVNRANRMGAGFEHKHLARTATGGRVD